MNRRGFMGAILAAGVAPAFIRYDALMRPVARDTLLIAKGVVIRGEEVTRTLEYKEAFMGTGPQRFERTRRITLTTLGGYVVHTATESTPWMPA